MILIFILTLAAVAAAGAYLYKSWREQQDYQQYRQDFQRQLSAQVEDANRLIPRSTTWKY